MVYQLSCPHCGSPIYFADRQESDEDFQEGLCKCRVLYALQQLDVIQLDGDYPDSVAGTDREVRKGVVRKALRALTPDRVLNWRRPSRSRQTYRLLAIEPDGRRQRTQFSGKPNGDDDSLEIWPEERLLMLYAIPNSGTDRPPLAEELVRVTSADRVFRQCQVSGQKRTALQPSGIEVSSLRWRLWKRRVQASGLSTVLGVGAAIPLHAYGQPSYWVAAGAVTIVTAALAGWSDRFRLRDRRLLKRLDAEQRLLQQQFSMEQKQELFADQLRLQKRLLKRLRTLRSRMESADEDMYARRIEVINRGISTVEETTTLTKNLRDGYGQLVKILAIEYETSRLAEQLPDNNSRDILLRVSELEAMEERRTSLEALVNPQQLLKAI